jgi:hypothetical protein
VEGRNGRKPSARQRVDFVVAVGFFVYADHYIFNIGMSICATSQQTSARYPSGTSQFSHSAMSIGGMSQKYKWDVASLCIELLMGCRMSTHWDVPTDTLWDIPFLPIGMSHSYICRCK